MAVTRLSWGQRRAGRANYEASAIGIDHRAIDLRGRLGVAREDRPSVVIGQLIAVHVPSGEDLPAGPEEHCRQPRRHWLAGTFGPSSSFIARVQSDRPDRLRPAAMSNAAVSPRFVERSKFLRVRVTSRPAGHPTAA